MNTVSSIIKYMQSWVSYEHFAGVSEQVRQLPGNLVTFKAANLTCPLFSSDYELCGLKICRLAILL
jgi:hypothetical protein